MKKNIKSKAIDLIIIFLCIAGSVMSGRAFWREYSRTLTKLNETPVGTVVFKKRTAQRKFIDRVIWDMLKQASGVYNGDTLRTISASEAVITFSNEVTHITMYANTLIQVFFNDTDGTRIDFSGGNIEVNSGDAKVVIVSGSSEIFVAGRAALEKKDAGFTLSVTEGEAVIDGEKIETGKMIILDEQGEIAVVPAITITSLKTSSRIIASSVEPVPVVFTWNAFNFNPDTYVIIETALDPSFIHIVQAMDAMDSATAMLNLNSGEYFWRAYPASLHSREPANPIYPSGVLEIIPLSQTALISPANETEIVTEGEPSVSLSWTAAQGAAGYRLEISANPGMGNPVVERQIEGTRVMQTGLDAGLWYWRVTPVLPHWVTGSLPPSETGSFRITRFVPSIPQETRSAVPETVESVLPQEAVEIPTPAAAREPASEELAMSFTDRGIQLRDQGDFDSAIEEFTRAIQIDPNYEPAYTQRGFTYIGQGHHFNNIGDFNRANNVFDKAIDDLNIAMQMLPNFAWHYEERGNAYRYKGEYDRAMLDYNRAIELDPNKSWAFNARGLNYLEKKDYNNAINDFNQAIRIDPNNSGFYFHRGNAYKNAGNLDRAIEDYNRAIQLNPNDAWAYHEIGFAYYDKGDYDNALTNFTELIRIDPNNSGAYRMRGMIYHEKGDDNRAIAEYNQAININPNNADYVGSRGYAYKDSGNLDRAIEDFEASIRIDPKYIWGYLGPGYIYKEKREFDRAIEYFEKALQIDPNNQEAHINTGVIYREKREFDRALTHFNHVINLFNNNSWAYHERGWNYMDMGNTDLALADFETALRLNPNSIWTYAGMGLVYNNKRDYNRAIENFETALRFEPDNKTFIEWLEMARRR